MFKSITFNSYDSKQYFYKLEDSEFGVVRVKVAHNENGISAIGEQALVIAREYSKRGLNVSKNLAIVAMWYCEIYRYNMVYKSKIETICNYQDEYCPKHFPNWKEYATSRDTYIAKMLLLK